MFHSWFGNLVTAPALRTSWEDGTLVGVEVGEQFMLAGITEYLSYHATAHFLNHDRNLADFFFHRAQEYVEDLQNPARYPVFSELVPGAAR